MRLCVQKMSRKFMGGWKFFNKNNRILRVKISSVKGITVTVTSMNTGQIGHKFWNLHQMKIEF